MEADHLATPVTMEEFERGVAFWKAHTAWSGDFHNQFYAQLHAENPNGHFDMEWWHGFLPHLHRWKATRGTSGASLTSRVTASFPDLTHAWRAACAPYLDGDVADARWEQIAPFAATVVAIKPLRTPSPVFVSKFCHFLAPRLFPVVDRAVMGNEGGSYQSHFEKVQRDWRATAAPTRSQLHEAMVTVVGEPLAPNFPVTNKAIELCMIGRHHGPAQGA